MAKRPTAYSKKANNDYNNLFGLESALEANKLCQQSSFANANELGSVCFLNDLNQPNQQPNECHDEAAGAMDFIDISEYTLGNSVKDEYHNASGPDTKHIIDESEQIAAIKRFLEDPSVEYIEPTSQCHPMDTFYNAL